MICSVPSQSPDLEGKLSKPFPLPPSLCLIHSTPLRSAARLTSLHEQCWGSAQRGMTILAAGNRARERESEVRRASDDDGGVAGGVLLFLLCRVVIAAA